MKIQISLVVIIITLIHQVYTVPPQKDERLIQSMCKNTSNYQLCINTLQADPKSATADVSGLALIVVEAVKAKAQQDLSAVNDLIKRGPQPALQTCTNNYNAVLKADVPVAVDAIKAGNPKFADDGMNDAAFEAKLCEDAFKGGVAPSPLSGLNKNVADLAGVAKAIIKNLL